VFFPKKLQNHAQYIMMLVECLNALVIIRIEKEEKNDVFFKNFLCGGSVELDYITMNLFTKITTFYNST
jgi:hypothetical protein